MRKKRKVTTKVRPPKVTATPHIEVPPLHISHPFCLYHKTEKKNCYFSDEIHMKKYIERCRLKVKDFTVTRTKPREKEE